MARRCSAITDRGSPCRNTGTGNPPLCHVHEALYEEGEDDEGEADAVVAATNAILDHPQAQGVISKFNGLLDRVGGWFERAGTGQAPVGSATRPQPHAPRGQPPPPPPPRQPPPRREAPIDARKILGFAPGLKLTVEMVKERRKDLAKLYHPDRGGHPEQMKTINAAADALLKEIG